MRKVDKGFTAIEALGVLMLISIAASIAADMTHTHLTEKEWRTMATHVTTFNEASKKYIADNTDNLLASTAGGNVVRIDTKKLIDNGYLQAGFAHENSYGQNYITSITRNSKKPNKLQALTCTTGGTEIPYKGLRFISSEIQGLGGYVYEKNGIATGAYGGWVSNTGDFGIECSVGHIAVSLSSEVLGTTMQESDRLYRFSVNNRPDLNRMHTSIDMNRNNINTIGTLGLHAGDGVDQGGFYMSDSQWISTINKKSITTAGKINADDRISSGEFLELKKISILNNSCSPAGLISRDNNGGILFCKNGKWTNGLQENGYYQYVGYYSGYYRETNGHGKPIIIHINGGNPPPKKVNSGNADSCANTAGLVGVVNGMRIAASINNNSNWAKHTQIQFTVPIGATYEIFSNPLYEYGCSPGNFDIIKYITY